MIECLSRSYLGEVTESLPDERAIVARIGTGDLDRFNTVIDPAGMDLAAFRTNPVVLWEHGRDPTRGRLPIGRNSWIKTRKSGNGELLAKTQFAKDEYSQNLYELYRDGDLRGWSISALPDEEKCSPPTKEERRARPELLRCLMMYRGSELTEYSGTSVPGNAKALTAMEERGIWFPAEAKTLAKVEELAQELKSDIEEERNRPPQLPPFEGTIVDVAAIHRHGIELIDRHCRRRLDMIAARLDLMRGRV